MKHFHRLSLSVSLLTALAVASPAYAATTSLSTFQELFNSGDTEYAGDTIAGAGDVNGDGYDDFLIGAKDFGANGAAYLVYGSDAQLDASDLSSAIVFTGENLGDDAGYSVAGAGDVNGDGYDDFLIGAPLNDDAATSAGAVYLIYGQSSHLSSASLSTAVEFTGEAANDEAGTSIASAGNVNGDAYDDIVIGAPKNDDAASNAGAVYLIYGQSSHLSSASLSTAVEFTGEAANDFAGTAVSKAGDANGNGYGDFLVGAPNNDDGGSAAGAVYLVYGSASTLTGASLGAKVEFTGEAAGDEAGTSVSFLGHANNDAFDDLLIGAPFNDDAASNAGAAYIMYGAALLNSRSLSTAVEFTGEAANDEAGNAVASAGDVDSDGYADAIVGAHQNDDASTDAGAVYLINGASSTLSGASLSTKTEFTGETTLDEAGFAVAYVGDVNGDGYNELLTRSYTDAVGRLYIGYLYIDSDGDGYFDSTSLFETAENIDCDDANAAAFIIYYSDEDGDGLGNESASDCQGATPSDSSWVADSSDVNDHDADNDGVTGATWTGTDCDDSNGAFSTQYFLDADGDGLGSDEVSCNLLSASDYVLNSSDLNDNDYDNDGAEIADDCDDTNDDIFTLYYVDEDADLLGVLDGTVCGGVTAPEGYADNSSDLDDNDYDNDGVEGPSWGGTDCDDGNSAIFTLYYIDEDLDGLGVVAVSDCQGSSPSEALWVANTLDANDSDHDNDGEPTVTDCDDADDSVTTTYFRDADSDGLGVNTTTICAGASAPSGYVTNYFDILDDDADNDAVITADDCNDTDELTYTLYYQDADADGLGNGSSSVCAGASAPSGYVSNLSDSNDDDADNDGVITADDCNDTDESAYTVYYQDADADGLGDSESFVCGGASAPSGYVSNLSDSNDAVVSSAPAGSHTETAEITEVEDLINPEIFETNIVSIVGASNGRIAITYSDDSTFFYSIFSKYSGSVLPKIKQYGDTGYIIVLHPKGKKIALVNPYTGEVLKRIRLSKSVKYKKNSLKLLDVRHDGSLNIVVTSKKKGEVRISLLKVNVDNASMKLKDSQQLDDANAVVVKKTKAPKKRIVLKDASGNTLYTFKVGKKYKMTLQ